MAWERLDPNRVAVDNAEMNVLLGAVKERDLLREQIALMTAKTDILGKQLALKDQESQIERKRADFAEKQEQKYKEFAEFQGKQYQELLKVKGGGWKELIIGGIIGTAIGIIIHGGIGW